MKGVPGAQCFACWIKASPKNAENGLDKPTLNLHLNKSIYNKERVVFWVTWWITSLTSPWPLLCCHTHTWTVFVVFGLRHHPSIAAVVFSASPPAGVHKPPPVSRQTWRSYVTHRARILGDRLINHGVRRRPPAFLTHADKSGATPLTRCIDGSPVVSAITGWSTHVPFSGTLWGRWLHAHHVCGLCQPHGVHEFGMCWPELMNLGSLWKLDWKCVSVCVHTCCRRCCFLHFSLNWAQTWFFDLWRRHKEG